MRRTDDVVAFLRDTALDADRGVHPPAVGVFARAYLRVTLEVIARIAAGTFEDPSWLAEFDVRFARLYLDALLSPSSRPRCWAFALERSARDDGRVLAHLLLGISAHMRYDLCAVLLGGFVEPGKREARRRDFLSVNRVMSRAIDPIQEVIEARYGSWLRVADLLGGGLDERLTFTGFRGWRDRAWDDAMRILDGELTLDDVDRRVTRSSRLIALVPA